MLKKHAIPLLAESFDLEKFALFPNELGGWVTITQDEMLQLSQIYSRLYGTYISRLSARLASQFDITDPAASLLARRALVPLIHCFMDRLLRVKKAIDCAPNQLVTPRQKLFPTFDTIEAFEQCAVNNPAFNQSMIWFVGRVWQLPESDPVPEQPLFTPQVGFKNNLFRLYPRTPLWLIKKIWLRLMGLLPRSRFPALTMANATGAFLQHGFYSKYLGDVSPKWPLAVVSIDRELREKLFSDDFIEDSELNVFLIELELEVHEQKRAGVLFKDFMQCYYPSSLLEAIPQNMKQALQALQPFKKRALISSSGRDSRSAYVVAGAKQMGLSIIDHQHGGHYGYLEDMSPILELEYPGVNQFISWGWSRLPDHSAVKGVSVIELPSPWLSERKRYWKKLILGGEREYDFLLMPNMVKRFPAAPQGASTSRIDLIQEFAASLKHLVSKATEGGIRILHKPYNTTTVNLLTKTMRELELIGGPQYCCEQQLDKGLTHELVQRCHVVLWDQPGTGFLECLSSNIPTMVYWPRTYNQEEAWVKPSFLELERLGIVHRDIDTLLEEFKKFKVSPESWMNNLERVALVNRFCRQFAWTSEEWPQYWRRYFDELSDSNGTGKGQ
jgi:hypothetical protein